jgi:hypothetical protein
LLCKGKQEEGGMKSLRSLALGTCAAAALFAGGASASVIYDNSTSTYDIDSRNIETFSVADSFTAASGLNANGATFVTWNGGGGAMSTVDWEITSGNPINGDPFTVLGSGTASVTSSEIEVNGDGFQVWGDSISFSNVSLTGGNYFLLLTGASMVSGGTAYWDENDGLGTGWQSGVGEIGSETFQILGGAVSGTPEPATWALMLAGFAGLGAALRSRRKLATA